DCKLLRPNCEARARAGHGSRRVQLLRGPVRHPRDRGDHPVADEPGTALGRRDRSLGRAHQAPARARGLPRELAEQALGRSSRPRDGSTLGPGALRRYARAGGLEGRDLPRHGGGERAADGRRLQRREDPVPDLTLVEADGLAAAYGSRVVLEDVSFSLQRRERIGVLGPNGGGKSTLFRVLLGLLPPAAGRFRVEGSCGFVPQTERSRLDYPVTALDVALMGTLTRVPWWRPLGRSERRLGGVSLERVGLAELADRSFGALSGGQRQRVLMARALGQEPPRVLL